MKIKDHILETAEVILSPNCDDRPDEKDINLLVIHNISLPPKQYGTPYVTQFFTNQLKVEDHTFFKEIETMKVSSHLFIQRTGHIIQFVPFHKRAYHAGVSSFEGREKCNDFSIGIEMEGCDDEPYEEKQYDVLAQVTQTLMNHYPITLQRIAGHSDIAPGRKTDPGEAFDWKLYRKKLGEIWKEQNQE